MPVRDQSWHSDSRLVAYYKLDDNLATTQVLDSSGNGNHGSASANTNTLSTNGPFGVNSAFNCNNGNVIKYINDFRITDSQGSIVAWARYNPYAYYPGIFSCHSGVSRTNGLFLYFIDESLRWQFSQNGVTLCVLGQLISQYAWQHVAAVSDGTKTTLYVNGVARVGEDSSNGAWFHDLSGTTTIFIGNLLGGTTNINISDLRIYSVALSANEIYAHYVAGIRRKK